MWRFNIFGFLGQDYLLINELTLSSIRNALARYKEINQGGLVEALTRKFSEELKEHNLGKTFIGRIKFNIISRDSRHFLVFSWLVQCSEMI